MIQSQHISPSNANLSVSLAPEKTYHFLTLPTKQRHWHPKCFHHSPDIWCHSITPKQAIKKGLYMWDITRVKQMMHYVRKCWAHEQWYLFLSYAFNTSPVNQATKTKKQKQQNNLYRQMPSLMSQHCDLVSTSIFIEIQLTLPLAIQRSSFAIICELKQNERVNQ